MPGFNTSTFIDRWYRLNLAEQLGNVGSEVDRVISWRSKGNLELSSKALDRTLDLLDLTIGDPRWHGGSRKELTRVREVLCDTFLGDNSYNTPSEFLSRYFYQFALAAQRNKGK